MPNNVNARNITIGYTDFSRERSTTQVRTAEFLDNAAYETARDALLTAMDAVTDGVRNGFTEQAITKLSQLPAASPDSARERKLLVSFQDSVTFDRYSFTIPTFDPNSVSMVANTDFVDLNVTAGQALKNAIEAFVRGPNTNNAIQVIEAKLVGRNL